METPLLHVSKARGTVVWTLDQVNRPSALVRDVLLRSWTKYFTLTVLPSTQEDKYLKCLSFEPDNLLESL